MGFGANDVSVIIPYYNRERYIDESVESVLAQTLKPLEVIIVNDCSRESSRRYLDKYAGQCKIVDLTTNVGLAAARNEGIRHARGRFIAFQDDDDIWLPEKLEKQRRYMDEHPECDAVHSAVWAFFHNGSEMLFSCNWPPPITLAQALTNDCWVSVQATLIRSEAIRAIGGFDPSFRVCEDRDFAIRCCAAGYRVEPMYEPLVRLRRQGHDSLTGRYWNIFLGDLKTCWKHKKLYYRAYGPRGFLSFLLEKLRTATYSTPFAHRCMHALIRYIPVKYQTRPGYIDPTLRLSPQQAVNEPDQTLSSRFSC